MKFSIDFQRLSTSLEELASGFTSGDVEATVDEDCPHL
jgi:hypothetical protein